MFHTINEIPTEFFAPPGFLYRFFLNPFWVVSASGLILLKGQASADIRPPAYITLAILIVARRGDRSVQFQAYRVPSARRDNNDIPPATHVALTILILARRDDRSVRFQTYRVYNGPFIRPLLSSPVIGTRSRLAAWNASIAPRVIEPP